MDDNIDQLSDKELHLELAKFGCNTPVLPTTRKVLITKLRKFLKENNNTSLQLEEPSTSSSRKRKSTDNVMPPPKIPAVQALTPQRSSRRRSASPQTQIQTTMIPVVRLPSIAENLNYLSEQSPNKSITILDETVSSPPRRKFPGRSKIAAMELSHNDTVQQSGERTPSPRRSYQPETTKALTTTIETQVVKKKFPGRSVMRALAELEQHAPSTTKTPTPTIKSTLSRRRTISSNLTPTSLSSNVSSLYSPRESITIQQVYNSTKSVGNFRTISIDRFGPLPETQLGYRWIFIVEDVSSLWVELFPLKKLSSEDCAQLLIDEIFLRYGTPHNIIAANDDVDFRNDIVKHLTYCIDPEERYAVRHNKRNVKSLLKVLLQDCTTTWAMHLPTFRFALNSLKCGVTHKIPAVNVFGVELRTVDEANDEQGEDEVESSNVACYLQNVVEAIRDFKEMA